MRNLHASDFFKRDFDVPRPGVPSFAPARSTTRPGSDRPSTARANVDRRGGSVAGASSRDCPGASASGPFPASAPSRASTSSLTGPLQGHEHGRGNGRRSIQSSRLNCAGAA